MIKSFEHKGTRCIRACSGDHRGPLPGGPCGGAAHPAEAAGAGCPDRDRRLRERLFGAVVSARPAGGQGQDGPQLRRADLIRRRWMPVPGEMLVDRHFHPNIKVHDDLQTRERFQSRCGRPRRSWRFYWQPCHARVENPLRWSLPPCSRHSISV